MRAELRAPELRAELRAAAHRSATDAATSTRKPFTRLETTTRDAITVAAHGAATTISRSSSVAAVSSSIIARRPTESEAAPSAGRLTNSSAAPIDVHAPSASATRSGRSSVAASTPGSACVVTAFTEIRLKSAR